MKAYCRNKTYYDPGLWSAVDENFSVQCFLQVCYLDLKCYMSVVYISDKPQTYKISKLESINV
jgi:hypothetical protein